MTTTVELPVIEMNKTKSRTVYWLTLFTTALVYLVLIIVFNDKNNLIGRLFLISMLAFVIGIFFLKKSHAQKGFLIINTDSIIYSTETKTDTFLTREISEISFLYDGYSGKPESSNLLHYSTGCRNILKFRHKDSETKFYVKLEYRYLGLVRRLFKEFESVGNPIAVLNTWGRKIEL